MRTAYFIAAGWILTLSLGFQSPLAKANDDRDRGITATGTCLKKVNQDRGRVTFTTNVLATTVAASSQQATQAHEKLRQALLALSLKDTNLDTAGYQVNEDREYQNNKWLSKGFRTQITLTLETSEFARLGEAVAAAGKMGVKNIDQLTTFVSPERHKSEYESCLEIASRNARDKAEKLAKGAGIKLGKVLAIIEGAAPHGEPVAFRGGFGAAKMASAPEAPTIDAKAEDLSVSATVTFATN